MYKLTINFQGNCLDEFKLSLSIGILSNKVLFQNCKYVSFHQKNASLQLHCDANLCSKH